jgi:CRP-like cAMP-binding protein
MNWSLLRTFIDNKAEFSEEEFSELKQCLVIKQFKKNEIILHQGEVCNFVGFINKGLLRSHYDDDSGKEITTKFFFENCLFTYVEGFMDNSPSNKTFAAMEETEVLVLKKQHLYSLFEKIPNLEKMFGVILLEDLKSIMTTEEEKRNESPQTRYLSFQKQFPIAFNRIPLKYLASFLGIEPQSLSRIRNRMTRK